MRIVNLKEKQTLDSLSIFFTKDEARQLISYLEVLIEDSSRQHSHLSSDDYQKEITLWIYDKKNFNELPPKVQKLIQEDTWTEKD